MKVDIIQNEEFRQALNDYYYLINGHYPEKGSLKLVGDRYQLSTELRTILYRGISSAEAVTKRKQRITKSPTRTLAIDGYNVLFTLLNYRLGRFVFISNDGICRDAGSLFGKIRNTSLFNECASMLIDYLSKFKDTSILLYLDSPVSFSKNHQKLLQQSAYMSRIQMEVLLVKSADQSLLEDTSYVIATSDSVLIDNLKKSILDIPKTIIENKYNYSMIDLGSLLK